MNDNLSPTSWQFTHLRKAMDMISNDGGISVEERMPLDMFLGWDCFNVSKRAARGMCVRADKFLSRLSEEDLELISCGDADEKEEKLSGLPGYEDANLVLGMYFEANAGHYDGQQ